MTLDNHPKQPTTTGPAEAARPRFDEESGLWLSRPDPFFPLRDAHDFLELALEAIAAGGEATSAPVMQAALWAEGKLAEFMRDVGPEAYAAAVRAAWGREPGPLSF